MAAQLRVENAQSIKSTIIEYISDHAEATRNDIIQDCGFSLPTVLQKIKELMEENLIEEIGQSESFGGRKAKILSISKNAGYAVGVNLTAHHVEMVVSGLNGDILYKKRECLVFSADRDYSVKFGEMVNDFIDKNVPDAQKLIGVGISVPAVLDKERSYIRASHALHLNNYSLKGLRDHLPYKVFFENDANAAAYSEKQFREDTVFYLSLNYTVGGSLSVNGKLYDGSNNKSSEIGHVVLFPEGEKCYCGKKGCVDAYCSAKLLNDGDLITFFEEMENGNEDFRRIWKDYLKNLSYVISNLRMLYDCDIIVGGHVGGHIGKYLSDLREYVMMNDYLDGDSYFIHSGSHRWEASAYGMAFHLIRQYFKSVS